MCTEDPCVTTFNTCRLVENGDIEYSIIDISLILPLPRLTYFLLNPLHHHCDIMHLPDDTTSTPFDLVPAKSALSRSSLHLPFPPRSSSCMFLLVFLSYVFPWVSNVEPCVGVWSSPSQFHLRLFNSATMLITPVFRSISLLSMVFGKRTFRAFFKHLPSNPLIFRSISLFVFDVSAPYKSTELTLLLYSLIDLS